MPKFLCSPYKTMVKHYATIFTSGPFYAALKQDPFNTFGRYIVQDRNFLSFYGNYKPLLALKMHAFYQQSSYSNFDLLRSQLDIFETFESKYGHASCRSSKVTINYEQKLLIALEESPEVTWSANLACPWLYLEVSRSMYKDLGTQHPCRPWVNFLASTEFETSLQNKIDLLHYLAERTTLLRQEQMFDALRDALELELCFFNQAAYLAGDINKVNL